MTGSHIIPVEAYKLRAAYKTLEELRDYLVGKKSQLIHALIYDEDHRKVPELRAELRMVEDALQSLEFFYQTNLSEEGKNYDGYTDDDQHG